MHAPRSALSGHAEQSRTCLHVAQTLKVIVAKSASAPADDWPATIATIFGHKTVAMVKGQQHLDIRKMFLSAFSPKTNEQYIPRITAIAEELCAKWAEVGQLKGEHAMKAFTGKVGTCHD